MGILLAGPGDTNSLPPSQTSHSLYRTDRTPGCNQNVFSALLLYYIPGDSCVCKVHKIEEKESGDLFPPPPSRKPIPSVETHPSRGDLCFEFYYTMNMMNSW